MGPTALSHLVQEKTPNLETVVHYCCRDRNLLGMQMDLMVTHSALGKALERIIMNQEKLSQDVMTLRTGQEDIHIAVRSLVAPAPNSTPATYLGLTNARVNKEVKRHTESAGAGVYFTGTWLGELVCLRVARR